MTKYRTTPREELGNWLRKSRATAGKTQADIAKALGYTTSQFISNWERGVSLPPDECFIQLAKELNLDPIGLAEKVLAAPYYELEERRQRVFHQIKQATKTTRAKRK